MWSKTLNPYKTTPVYYGPHGAKPRIITSKVAYDSDLAFNAKVGDILYYRLHESFVPDIGRCSLVIYVEPDYDKLKWNHYTGMPESHQVVFLGNAKYNNDCFYPRAVDIGDYEIVPVEKLKGQIDADVQDYITRALAHGQKKGT